VIDHGTLGNREIDHSIIETLSGMGFDPFEVMADLNCPESKTKQVIFDPFYFILKTTVTYFLFKDHKVQEQRMKEMEKMMKRRYFEGLLR
jgi:hypothetical protein